ncbi:MAG TPA: DUF4012 domain-containing protein [Candidatus Moranbacteria bacterium]|nr:DUF4012 domain-containing protein [Candidatus Moranbacteria bacterium]
MGKKRSKKFWIIFWSLSIVFLGCWYAFWQIYNKGYGVVEDAVEFLPFSEENKTLGHLAGYILKKDNEEKTFLVLFQNNMEIRPGGGYIGSFGILTIKNGEILKMETHDLSNFDGRIPDTVSPPYPMKETLRINSWKLRDSNFSPDFPTNAKKAEEFYRMGQGQEKLDGIIAINSNVLTSFLKVTGPVEIEGYPGTYSSENAILNLEYQVEQGYAKQGIERGERKSVMNGLAKEVLKRVSTLGNAQKLELAKIILEDLKNKDIQLYFKNSEMERHAHDANWNGEMEKNGNEDYLMMVDANMGSLKSDYYMKRSFEYTVDLSKNVPEANLKITYNHTAKEKDWMTKNYLTYFRLYVPANSWLVNSQNTSEVRFGKELDKKYFGTLVNVPLGETKTIEFNYTLPSDIDTENYNLMIQKQSGVSQIPGKVTVIGKDGSRKTIEVEIKQDWKLK